jgi:hypothetical protein
MRQPTKALEPYGQLPSDGRVHFSLFLEGCRMSKPEAPKGLSAGARRRWAEQVAALDAAGRATTPRLELVSSWARAIDAAGHARAVWEEAGSPESELGSQGQDRAHHLRVALTRADALVAMLGAKIERAVARKESRVPAVPTGARVLRRDGSYVEALVDGRVMTRSVSSGSWVLSADEQDFESGGLLRWVDADGMPTFHDPPPMRAWSGLPAEAEALEWATAVGAPAEAVLAWLRHRTPRSKILAREDVGLLAFVRGD